MHCETNVMKESMVTNIGNKLSLKRFGRINCRSCLGNRNPVRDEIQQIIDRIFPDGNSGAEAKLLRLGMTGSKAAQSPRNSNTVGNLKENTSEGKHER
mgnify:CR=1 FL=1